MVIYDFPNPTMMHHVSKIVPSFDCK